MAEWQLFPDIGAPPEHTTAGWYAERDTAPHLEQEGHRQRLLLTAEMVREARLAGARSMVDLGAGDGGLLSLVGAAFRTAGGYDLQPSNVEAAAARGARVELGDVLTVDWGTPDLAVAAEILEHLVDPHGLVKTIAGRSRWLVASSPYTETAGGHYAFHTWAWDCDGYRELLEQGGWRVLRHETAWISQVILAERA